MCDTCVLMCVCVCMYKCMSLCLCSYVCLSVCMHVYELHALYYCLVCSGDTDYNSSAINVTFPIEDTSYRAFFEVSIYNDNLVEGNETFFLVIDNSSLPEDVSLGRPHQLNVTITEGNSMLI